jgi:hypothetical protein
MAKQGFCKVRYYLPPHPPTPSPTAIHYPHLLYAGFDLTPTPLQTGEGLNPRMTPPLHEMERGPGGEVRRFQENSYSHGGREKSRPYENPCLWVGTALLPSAEM